MQPGMDSDSDQNRSSRARRGAALDRKLGVLWSRFWALVVGSAGIALVLWYFTSAENMAFGSTLFITTIGVLLLAVSRHLWNNNDDLSAILDDVDSSKHRSGQKYD